MPVHGCKKTETAESTAGLSLCPAKQATAPLYHPSETSIITLYSQQASEIIRLKGTQVRHYGIAIAFLGRTTL